MKESTRKVKRLTQQALSSDWSPTESGEAEPSGHMEGVTPGHLERLAQELTPEPELGREGHKQPCSRGLQTGLATEQTAREEPFSVGFSTLRGPVDKHLRITCARYMSAVQREPRALGQVSEPLPMVC